MEPGSSLPTDPHFYRLLFLHVGLTVTSSWRYWGLLCVRTKILLQSSILANQTLLYCLQEWGHCLLETPRILRTRLSIDQTPHRHTVQRGRLLVNQASWDPTSGDYNTKFLLKPKNKPTHQEFYILILQIENQSSKHLAQDHRAGK